MIMNLYGYIGDVAFCMGGVLIARNEKLSRILQIACGVSTAFMGGITRDLVMLGTTPKILGNPHEFIAVVVFAAMLTLALSYRKGSKSASVVMKKSLVILDSLGVLAFSIVGFERAIAFEGSYLIALVCGLFTACGGGFIALILRTLARKGNERKRDYLKKAIVSNASYYVFCFVTTLTYGFFFVAGVSMSVSAIALTGLTVLLGLLTDKEINARG